jgi:solute carrier family 35 protein
MLRAKLARTAATTQVFNKAALRVFPFPMQLTSAQYLISALAVLVLAAGGMVEAEGLRWQKVKAFWLVSACFSLAIFSNTLLLHHTSIETAIVFRTTVSLLTSIGDYVWLGKELPSRQSWLALLSIVFGAYGYMVVEGRSITLYSLLWGIFYVLILSFEMIYVKHVVTRARPFLSIVIA